MKVIVAEESMPRLFNVNLVDSLVNALVSETGGFLPLIPCEVTVPSGSEVCGIDADRHGWRLFRFSWKVKTVRGGGEDY